MKYRVVSTYRSRAGHGRLEFIYVTPGKPAYTRDYRRDVFVKSSQGQKVIYSAHYHLFRFKSIFNTRGYARGLKNCASFSCETEFPPVVLRKRGVFLRARKYFTYGITRVVLLSFVREASRVPSSRFLPFRFPAGFRFTCVSGRNLY